MIRKVPDDQKPADEQAAQAEELPADEQAADQPQAAEAHAEDAETEAAGDAAERLPAEEPDEELPPTPCDRPLEQRLEAVLFAAGNSLSAQRLARALGEDLEAVKEALAGLIEAWAERPGAIDLVEISGGFRFMTRPSFADDVAGLAKKAKLERLSPAALETLAIVAYKQPVGRADIEAVRGVQSGPLLRVLLDRDLIRIAGRSPEPGHPLLYGTTKRFLDHFGLSSLKALPDITDLLDVS